MKITLNIKDGFAANIVGTVLKKTELVDGMCWNIQSPEQFSIEVYGRLQMETKDAAMIAASKSNVGGTLSFHNDG